MSETDMILRELTLLREQVRELSDRIEHRVDRIDSHISATDARVDAIEALHQRQAGAYGLAVAVVALAGASGGLMVAAMKWLAARI